MMRRPEERTFDALDRFLRRDACEQGFYVKTDEDLVRLDGPCCARPLQGVTST